MVTKVKQKFGYDDSLDAFGVHGVGGTLGALLTGVFATNAVNDALKNSAGQAGGARIGGWQRYAGSKSAVGCGIAACSAL